MVANNYDRTFRVEELAVGGRDVEGDAGGIAHDEGKRAGRGPLREAMEGEGAEGKGGEDAIDSADEEGGVGGETAGGEGDECWWAWEEVGEGEKHGGEGEVDGCYENRIIDECVHVGCVRELF